jgi:hypothetical protein
MMIRSQAILQEDDSHVSRRVPGTVLVLVAIALAQPVGHAFAGDDGPPGSIGRIESAIREIEHESGGRFEIQIGTILHELKNLQADLAKAGRHKPGPPEADQPRPSVAANGPPEGAASDDDVAASRLRPPREATRSRIPPEGQRPNLLSQSSALTDISKNFPSFDAGPEERVRQRKSARESVADMIDKEEKRQDRQQAAIDKEEERAEKRQDRQQAAIDKEEERAEKRQGKERTRRLDEAMQPIAKRFGELVERTNETRDLSGPQRRRASEQLVRDWERLRAALDKVAAVHDMPQTVWDRWGERIGHQIDRLSDQNPEPPRDRGGRDRRARPRKP